VSEAAVKGRADEPQSREERAGGENPDFAGCGSGAWGGLGDRVMPGMKITHILFVLSLVHTL